MCFETVLVAAVKFLENVLGLSHGHCWFKKFELLRFHLECLLLILILCFAKWKNLYGALRIFAFCVASTPRQLVHEQLWNPVHTTPDAICLLDY